MRSGRALPTPGQSAGRLPIRVFLPTLPARIRYCFLPAGISRATQGLRAATCLATPGCLAEAASQEWTLSGNQFTWLGDRCWPVSDRRLQPTRRRSLVDPLLPFASVSFGEVQVRSFASPPLHARLLAVSSL